MFFFDALILEHQVPGITLLTLGEIAGLAEGDAFETRLVGLVEVVPGFRAVLLAYLLVGDEVGAIFAGMAFGGRLAEFAEGDFVGAVDVGLALLLVGEDGALLAGAALELLRGVEHTLGAVLAAGAGLVECDGVAETKALAVVAVAGHGALVVADASVECLYLLLGTHQGA